LHNKKSMNKLTGTIETSTVEQLNVSGQLVNGFSFDLNTKELVVLNNDIEVARFATMCFACDMAHAVFLSENINCDARVKVGRPWTYQPSH
jgi:hypothetical protein